MNKNKMTERDRWKIAGAVLMAAGFAILKCLGKNVPLAKL